MDDAQRHFAPMLDFAWMLDSFWACNGPMHYMHFGELGWGSGNLVFPTMVGFPICGGHSLSVYVWVAGQDT
jgi:hypothetical protein